jgi:DNA-binding protein H-NS
MKRLRNMRKQSIDLKSFSIDELLDIRERVDALIESRVDTERRALQMRLQRLQKFKPHADKVASAPRRGRPSKAAVKRKRSAAKSRKSTYGKKVPPKFRNPDNPAESWSGRGLQPRWLAAAIKSGKSIEDFRI